MTSDGVFSEGTIDGISVHPTSGCASCCACISLRNCNPLPHHVKIVMFEQFPYALLQPSIAWSTWYEETI